MTVRALTPQRSAIVYAVASVVLGPAVLLLGYVLLFTRGGGDFCDPIYRLSDGSFEPARDREFRNAQLFQVIGASVMLLVGIGILAALARHRARSSPIAAVVATAVTTVMMLGYVAVILNSGHAGQVC